MEEDNFVRFLRDRGVSESQLAKLQNDKIDKETAKLMSDEQLTSYLPARGDRLALIEYCTSKPRESTADKKKTLFHKLRCKMKLRQPTGDLDDSDNEDDIGVDDEGKSTTSKVRRLMGNKNAAKKTRRLELGWLHMGRQVRKRNGGGTRTLDVIKSAMKKDLLHHCKELFFPGGQSKQYSLEEVSCEILDFKETILPDNVTVGEVYERVKMGIVRFYLSTTFKVSENDEASNNVPSNNEVCHNVSKPDDKASTSTQPPQSTISHHEALARTSQDSAQPSTSYHNISNVSSNIIHFGPTNLENELDLADTLPLDTIEIETSELTEEWPDIPFTVNYDLTRSPRSPTPPPDVSCVAIHRVNILEEMINHFKNDYILNTNIKFIFIGESGSDISGVSREAYTAFWSEFFIGEAEGEESRVPAINTKWQEEEWRAIGRILLKGFSDHGVFPLKFSVVFATAVIHGEEDVSPEMLIDDFLLYLCPTERDLVECALAGGISDDQQEDLIDFFDRFGCRRVPQQDEMRSQIQQIAHKELIQRPKYALDKIKEIVHTGLTLHFPSTRDLIAMYKAKKPTVKKVLKLLKASPTTSEENQAMKYLQQFIRAQSDISLKKFLRFLTGADSLCVDEIKVTFTQLEGLARRPVAHTCAPLLELPSTYQSYPEFRREMESLLSREECFVMDLA